MAIFRCSAFSNEEGYLKISFTEECELALRTSTVLRCCIFQLFDTPACQVEISSHYILLRRELGMIN